MKKFVVALVVLLAANVAVGQHSFMENHTESGSSAISIVSHVNTCGEANCWHQSSHAAINLQRIYASNSMILGIDGNCQGYIYADYPTNSWTAHPEWGCVYALQSDLSGNIWALIGNCGSGYYLGEWNGSGFTTQGVCYQQFAISQQGDGFILGRDINGTCWTNNSNGNWTHCTPSGSGFGNSCPGNGIAVVSASLYYATCWDTGNIWENNNGTWTQLPGQATLGENQIPNIAVSADNDLYVIGSGHSAYHYNGSGWDSLSGSGRNSIAVGDPMSVWTTGPINNGNSTYRFTETTYRHTITVNETANCVGCTHHVTGFASWNGNGSRGSGAGSYDGGFDYRYNPSGHPIQSSSQSDLLDFLVCVENEPDCSPRRDDQIVCTVAGSLLLEALSLALPESGFRTGSGYVTQVTRKGVGNNYAYCLADNCNPQGTMNMGTPAQNCQDGNLHGGGNVPDRMLDNTNTDTSVTVQAWCVWGGLWPTLCIVPGKIWQPYPELISGDITARNVAIPYPYCSQ